MAVIANGVESANMNRVSTNQTNDVKSMSQPGMQVNTPAKGTDRTNTRATPEMPKGNIMDGKV
jgi:hypothetical protein